MYDILNHCYAFLAKGGVFMIPIALCSVASVVLFVERCMMLHRARRDMEKKKTALLHAIQNKQYERAYALCDDATIPFVVIARKALDSRLLTREALSARLDEAACGEVARLERFFSMLGAIASISPLLGLLGTVTGMIEVFGRVAEEFDRGGQPNAGMLAGGIWEALITTAAGLCVAIPAFIMHRYLVSRLDAYVLELEEASTALLDAIAPPPERTPMHLDASPATGDSLPSKGVSVQTKPPADKGVAAPDPVMEPDDET